MSELTDDERKAARAIARRNSAAAFSPGAWQDPKAPTRQSRETARALAAIHRNRQKNNRDRLRRERRKAARAIARNVSDR